MSEKEASSGSSEEEMTKCSDCDKEFRSAKGMAVHRGRVHAKKSAVTVPGVPQAKTYSCPSCSQLFSTRDQLNRHGRQHQEGSLSVKIVNLAAIAPSMPKAEEASFEIKCTECEARFFDNDIYRYHLQSHASDRVYHCKECNIYFDRLVPWLNHTHTK